MSFRERTAWITLISIVVCFGVYYGAIFTGLVSNRSMGAFHIGLACIIGLLLMQIVLNLIAALLNPKEARTPRDERERIIHARSHTIGYYVLMIGTAGVLVSTHIPRVHRGDMDSEMEFISVIIDTVNIGVAVMVVAALTVAIAQIVMFRRGS
jgi:hypothetical protein